MNESLSKQPELIAEMYKEYFLDYASYVILERAIPAAEDGLKPVQRRILHAMFQMNDGRYHKVANIIGQTMQYHPHGDAAIGDALVNLGQKDLLIDCQGNWGDFRTGDSAAAPRYIEARLSKFALEVVFNPKITSTQLSYDGRKSEPITLPVKFPLLLAQGVEGIAVGLSTKILPHNFQELLQASIDILKGKAVEFYPDFPTGGFMDVSNYDCQKRGGKVRVRAKIEIADRKSIIIRDIPFGTTTENLIESIKKAQDKGKLKFKQITDKTAEHVEILIELAANGPSPEQTVDALYAFSDCELSISPNICVIQNDKPLFLSAAELLELSTLHTKDLLRQELEVQLRDLERRWHLASLEKIFIEHKIYQRIETCETWEAVLQAIEEGLQPHILHLREPVTLDDIKRLTEIKIKRISKYDQGEADRLLKAMEEQMEELKHHLAHLNQFAIDYFKGLLKNYGKGRERKTEIQRFDVIEAAKVVINNEKLYINRAEGFVGYGLKKDEFVEECSDIDDIIVFQQDGSFTVHKIAEKLFVGKNPAHVAVWKKGNERLIYNAVYVDMAKSVNYVKRFAVTAITRDKSYPIADGMEQTKLLYFSANPNGEAETISVQLTKNCSAKIKEFDFDFAELEVKGRAARGNTLTKYPIRKIQLKKAGYSTLDALSIWLDEETGRLGHQKPGVGRNLGTLKDSDKLLALYQDGTYELMPMDINFRFDMKELIALEAFDHDMPVTAVYYDGERKASYAKRFLVETSSLNQRFNFLPNEHKQTQLFWAGLQKEMRLEYKIKLNNGSHIGDRLNLHQIVSLTGWKALGYKISDLKLSQVKILPPEEDNNQQTLL